VTSQEPIEAEGILPVQAIARLVESGAVVATPDLAENQIQPASLDLRLGDVAYRVRASFLPGRGRTVAQRLGDLKLHAIPLSEGAVLETGCVYIVPLAETLALPANLTALTNPKSSTGRLDVFTRIIADGASGFDTIPPGYHGPLYVEISPRTFPILVRSGSRLTQIRFRRGRAGLDDSEILALQGRARLVDTELADIARGIALTVDLHGTEPGAPVGWRAKRHTALIDVDRIAAYDPFEFWDPLLPHRGGLILDPGQFYILASREAIQIPPDHAAEMEPFNPLVGEFRVHYAGFFDPGFGTASEGGVGSRAVLEVRSHEVPFILEHGQTVGRLLYERMTERPLILYGKELGSTYQSQRLRLSKHFAV
jgi:dCTP deaminase